MQYVDKIFAGLILTAMALFWVIMSPAAITSRISEARPNEAVEPVLKTSTNEEKPTANEKRRRTEQRLLREQTARLRERKRDTPSKGAMRVYHQRTDEPLAAPTPDELRGLQNFEDIPDYPKVY